MMFARALKLLPS
nr:unnamed protein product [Callosobruchus analis]CAI5841770.1 unnamed protein product [Callosobruchus analis]